MQLSGQLVGSGGQIEVLGGEAAGIVGDERKPDPVVADIDVRMVAGLFGQLADPVDKAQRGAKILELKGSYQLAGFDLPVRQGAQASVGLFGERVRA